METPGFKTFRKIGNPNMKRSMKMSVAEARFYDWELDEDPAAIKPTAPKEPFKTPPIPESAKAAIPKPAPAESTDKMPEVVKPVRSPRKPSTKK